MCEENEIKEERHPIGVLFPIKAEYHQVGVLFPYDGTTLVAVEQTNHTGCYDCYCAKEERELLCKQLLCCASNRPDGKEVTFKEVIR